MGTSEYLHLKEPTAACISYNVPLSVPPWDVFSSLQTHFKHTHTNTHTQAQRSSCTPASLHILNSLHLHSPFLGTMPLEDYYYPHLHEYIPAELMLTILILGRGSHNYPTHPLICRHLQYSEPAYTFSKCSHFCQAICASHVPISKYSQPPQHVYKCTLLHTHAHCRKPGLHMHPSSIHST